MAQLPIFSSNTGRYKMGEVIDFETGEPYSGLSLEASALMEEVFRICTDSPVDPEEIIWLMMTTFGNSLFYGVERGRAVDLFSRIVMALLDNNEVKLNELRHIFGKK